MGLFDLLRPGRDESERTASALEAARANAPDDSAIGRLVQVFMDAGLDGRGGVDDDPGSQVGEAPHDGLPDAAR